jgi:bifunctional UDP-N-acetylglucosamine pyrophosphorylase/glucosamine-1-phosphate N-acetyltransferase
MLSHVLAAAGGDSVAAVVGPDREDVAARARMDTPGADVFVQSQRLGTAHAVLAAREAIARGYDDLLVVFADTPLVRSQSLLALRAALADGASVAAMGFEARDPNGYGRLLLRGDSLEAIREQKDANADELSVKACNAGIMALDGRRALELLDSIGSDNAQNEFYLTDAVKAARERGLRCVAVMAPEEDAMGVNDRVQLAAAEAVMQRRLRESAMRAGATMIAPETVFMSFDTQIGRDVLIEPHVVFGPGVILEDGCVVHAFSHLESAKVGAGANVGPFARLRPGANLGQGAKVGNFVEIKASDLGPGAKVSHLSYIGDASIGADANIGAGTITCNYDGFGKFRTNIGAGAFVGSNTSLVAPVSVGAGAYVGSGSVITQDVPPDSLAVARGRQADKPGWAAAFRAQQKPKNTP